MPDRNGKIFYTSITSLSHISKINGDVAAENGVVTYSYSGVKLNYRFAFKDKDGNIQSFEYVFFPLGATGVAFSDGTHNYAYLSSYVSFIDDKFKNVSGLNVTEKDQEKLATLKEEDLKTLQDTKNQMLEDFKEALANVGVNAVINSDTGEILFDSSILFAKNESSVSEEGKIALENFSKVFSEILKKEEYQNFLAQVKIQGHTDSDGDYDYNKTLSQERADAVKNCIMENLSDDAGASALCEKLFATEGCASDYLITDENGAEDKTASRRVVFVFYIDLDYLNQ